jgi:hypothetical protein
MHWIYSPETGILLGVMGTTQLGRKGINLDISPLPLGILILEVLGPSSIFHGNHSF